MKFSKSYRDIYDLKEQKRVAELELKYELKIHRLKYELQNELNASQLADNLA